MGCAVADRPVIDRRVNDHPFTGRSDRCRRTPTAPGLVLFGLLLLLLGACNGKSNSSTSQQNDSTTRSFGDSVPISNGLLGRVYLLPDTTHWLPDFDTMTPVDNPVYANEINIPWQKWTSGFPGLRDRVEWFGIEYTGSFKPTKAGTYIFKLISDDGSKLFIDGKKVIDNDGIHMEWAGRDTLYLSDAPHSIKLDYFQGPRYELALQLYWNQPDSLPRIFPGKDFILYPPPSPSSTRWWIWLLAALAVVALFFLLRKTIRPRPAIIVPFLILQCAALPGRSQFLKNVLNSVKNTATNRANNKAAQVTNTAADKVESVGTSKPGASGTTGTGSGTAAPGSGTPASGSAAASSPATAAGSANGAANGGASTGGGAATNPPDHDSDSSFLSLSLSATRIIAGSLVTISGKSIKFGNMKDVQMTVKGNAGTETKTILLTDTGHFKTTWGTGMAGEYQITILSSNRKSSKTVTVKVFRLMSMDSVVQKNKDDTKEAYDQLKQWIDQVKSKLGPTDGAALQKKFDDFTDKKDKVLHTFDDLSELGKSLDKLQQTPGGSGGGTSGTGGNGGGPNGGTTEVDATDDISPELQSNLTFLTNGLNQQASEMDALNKAAAHKPYDNTICEYIQMVTEVCAAFSSFTSFFNPKGILQTSVMGIAKNVAMDKGITTAEGAIRPNASGLGSDVYKEVSKQAIALADDSKALSNEMGQAGLAGDLIQICSNYIMSKYCGVLSGDMSQDYKCTFTNNDNARWWEYTYHNEATVNLRYLKSAATSSLIKMKGNIEGNATKFTIFQKVSEMDDFKKAMKNRAQIFSICLWVPPTAPVATSQADRQTGFGAVARGVVTPAYFNIPIDADYNPETGQMKIYVNEAIIDYSSEVEYTYGYLCIAAMIPLTTKVHFPINKAKLTIAKVIEKNNDFQVKADANGKLSFNKTAQWTNGPEGSIVHIINMTMSAKSN
jgi:hypothetical protein